MAERATISLERPQQGAFTLAIYRQVLEKVVQGGVFTLTVSTGDEERVFFFTRGAILFLAVGVSGGEVLARKIVAKRLLAKERVDALVKRANADTPLLQDILRDEMLLDPKVVASLVEETLEDHLLEVMLWESAPALYDLLPGNPPTRIYEPDVPAVRLSVGSKALLERVLARQGEAARVAATLGAFRNRVRVEPGSPARPIRELLALAQGSGESVWQAASALAVLVQAKKVPLERVPERSKEEEIDQASRIEVAFDGFVNALLARTHLAALYERADEKEKAAEQFRGIAQEHLRRDAVDAGVAALKNVTRLLPDDVGARELLVKVLRDAGRMGDAARESVDLARVFLDQNFPGRARQAYELALRLVPGSLSVLWMLAGLLGVLGEKEAAIRRYEEIAAIARKAGDQDAEIAAAQQILDLDARHASALALVRRLSGYKDALRRRIAAVSVSFLVFLLVVAYGSYELAALAAYRRARDQARAAVLEPSFDVARSAVEEFRKGWRLTRLRASADELRRAIDEEERLFRAQRSLEAERQARALEAKDELPRAAERWRSALADAQDPERRKALEALLAPCEARIKKVQDDVTDAREEERQGRAQHAYDLVAADLPHAPWLAEDADFRVPFLLDSTPRDARITFDGQLQEKPTPLLLRRPLAPVHVRLEGRNRDPLEWDVAGPQPWPYVAVLPRKAVWRAKDVAATGAPLVLRDLVVVGGADRSLTAVARDTGTVRWRASLGVFGECDGPLLLLDQGVLVARARAGALHVVTSSGAVRSSLELEPPPAELVEAHPGKPVATPRGALVRVGARGLAVIAPEKAASPAEQVVWQARAERDLVGAPALAGDVVLVAAERRVLAFKAATGEPAWTKELATSPVAGPVVGPKGAIFVPLEQGALAILDARTRDVTLLRDRFEGGVSTLEGDPRWALVGTRSGDFLALDETGKAVFRAYADQQRPVLWARATSGSVLFGDASMLYVLDREGKELWRHPVTDGTPAASDEHQVFQGSLEGLTAFDR